MLCVYMLTNKNNTVLYTGVTNNIARRLFEHKHKITKGFTAKYNTCKLAYFECTDNVLAAIEREKQIKDWTREKKNKLIDSINPDWNDISDEWT